MVCSFVVITELWRQLVNATHIVLFLIFNFYLLVYIFGRVGLRIAILFALPDCSCFPFHFASLRVLRAETRLTVYRPLRVKLWNLDSRVCSRGSSGGGAILPFFAIVRARSCKVG